MKRYVGLFLAVLGLVLGMFKGGYANEVYAKDPPEDLYALSAALVDGDTGRLLWGKNADEPMAMASTTKIMTCLIALEYGDMDDLVTFSGNAASMPEVKLGASAGETFRMEDLLYAMMLESYNDVAVAIAEHVGGSEEGFARLMNEKAASLGCVHTSFVTANGLDADGHQTTAAELGAIASHAVKNDVFCQIIGTKEYVFSNTDGKTYRADNADAFLDQMEGAFGIKTGYTADAGYCFVGALRDDGRTFISVVLGSGWPPYKDRKWSDTRELMEYGMQAYQLKTVGVSDMDLGGVAIADGMTDELILKSDTEEKTFLFGAEDRFNVSVVKDSAVAPAPVSEGETVGRVMYKINGDVVASFPVYTEGGCDKKTFWNSLRKIYRIWLEN